MKIAAKSPTPLVATQKQIVAWKKKKYMYRERAKKLEIADWEAEAQLVSIATKRIRKH